MTDEFEKRADELWERLNGITSGNPKATFVRIVASALREAAEPQEPATLIDSDKCTQARLKWESRCGPGTTMSMEGIWADAWYAAKIDETNVPEKPDSSKLFKEYIDNIQGHEPREDKRRSMDVQDFIEFYTNKGILEAVGRYRKLGRAS